MLKCSYAVHTFQVNGAHYLPKQLKKMNRIRHWSVTVENEDTSQSVIGAEVAYSSRDEEIG